MNTQGSLVALCGWCGTRLQPTKGQKSALTRQRPIFCLRGPCYAKSRIARRDQRAGYPAQVPCGWCGRLLAPTKGHKTALARTRSIYCPEGPCYARAREEATFQRVMHQGAQMIAHCGAWHPLTTLPWSCPQCGAVVGQAKEGAA